MRSVGLLIYSHSHCAHIEQPLYSPLIFAFSVTGVYIEEVCVNMTEPSLLELPGLGA